MQKSIKSSRQEIREWYNLRLLARGLGRVSSVKFVFLLLKAMDAQNGGSRLKIEAWRFCRSVLAGSHHLDEEQDPGLQ